MSDSTAVLRNLKLSIDVGTMILASGHADVSLIDVNCEVASSVPWASSGCLQVTRDAVVHVRAKSLA